MNIDRISNLRHRPPMVVDLSKIDRSTAAATLTEETAIPDRLPCLDHLREIWALGLKAEQLRAVLARADPGILVIEGTHFYDLGFLARSKNLRGLSVDWNTKVTSLQFLSQLQDLEALSLTDLKRVSDLRPLAALKGLRALQIAGGTWSKFSIETLEPLAQLTPLEELRVASVRIKDGSLSPLARMPGLKRMMIPGNAAATAEFAHLSARLQNVACEALHPYIRFDGVIMPAGTDPVVALQEMNDDTVLITGKGKPFLRAQSDRARILRYCSDFEAMRAKAATTSRDPGIEIPAR